MAAIRIGELLVQAGLLTPDQLEKALTAQRIHGGRLGTNLIEQGYVNERQLAGALSSQLGIPLVETDRLATIHPEILGTIPKELAARYRVVPFAVDPETKQTSIASAEPANLHLLDELQFVLGRRLRLFLCPELVLASALERHYGLQREKRSIAVAQLQGSTVSSASVPDATTSTGCFRRGDSGDILARLLEAPSREALIASLLESLAALCQQSVLFARRGDELMAWQARGLPLEQTALRRVALSPATCKGAGRVLAGEGHRADLDVSSWSSIEEALFVDSSGGALLLPILVGRKTWGALLAASLREPRLLENWSFLDAVLDRFALRLQALELMERAARPLPSPA